MSIGKSIATFLLGAIFILSLTTAVSSYVFKDVIKKDNLSNFIKTEMIPIVVADQCSNECQRALEINSSIPYDFCIRFCTENAMNQTQSMDSYIDSIYSQKVAGFTLEDLANILDVYFIPVVVLVILSLIGLAYLAENPFSTIGRLLTSASLPILAIGIFSKIVSLPSEIITKIFDSYLAKPLMDMLVYGIIILVAGIVLSIYGYYYKKKKKRK